MLSKAEAEARYEDFAILSKFCPDFFQAAGQNIKSPQEFIDTLGGTIRIAEKIESGNDEEPMQKKNVPEGVANYLHATFPEGKIVFGISVFPDNFELCRRFILDTKKALIKLGRSSRFINRQFRNLDAGTLHTEKLFQTKGAEILIIFGGNGKVSLARTVAAQNVEEFAKRDYGKPVRDMKTGMLPPKLALTLVNLAAVEKQLPEHVWEPFCGTGSILVEAARLGIGISGSDFSEAMVKASQQNLAHFFPNRKFQVFLHDATKTPPKEISAMAIISEGFLGPLITHPLTQSNLEKARQVVDPIYARFFAQAAQCKSVRRLVICLPFWRMETERNAFLEKALAEAHKFWKNALACDGLTSRGSLLFRRDNQFVGREIFVFQKR